MRRPVVKYGNPILEKVAEPVTEFDTPELRQLIADMFETMYDSRGVGLAAPQVGIGRRLAIVDTSAGEDPERPFVMINPEILETSGSQTGEEGCLSIPGFREEVTRPNKVRLRAQNEKGEWFEMDAEELAARAILHENDHLNGVLFLSHLSALKRELIRRKIKRLQKAGEW